jgi:hypothetical protein
MTPQIKPLLKRKLQLKSIHSDHILSITYARKLGLDSGTGCTRDCWEHWRINLMLVLALGASGVGAVRFPLHSLFTSKGRES